MKLNFTTETYAAQSVTVLGYGSVRAVAAGTKSDIRQADGYLTDIIQIVVGLDMGQDWAEWALAGGGSKFTLLPYQGAKAQAGFGSRAIVDDSFPDGASPSNFLSRSYPSEHWSHACSLWQKAEVKPAMTAATQFLKGHNTLLECPLKLIIETDKQSFGER